MPTPTEQKNLERKDSDYFPSTEKTLETQEKSYPATPRERDLSLADLSGSFEGLDLSTSVDQLAVLPSAVISKTEVSKLSGNSAGRDL